MEVDGEEYKVSNSPDEVVLIGDKEEDGITRVEEVVKVRQGSVHTIS